MTCRMLLGIALAIAGLASAAGQERLVIVPRVAPVDKPFRVALPAELLEAQARGESPIRYQWNIAATHSGAAVAGDAGIEGLAGGKIATKLPDLEVKTPVRGATYRFEVRASNADDDVPPSIAVVDLTGEVARLAAVEEQPPAETPATAPPATAPLAIAPPPAASTSAAQPGATTESDAPRATTAAASVQPIIVQWPQPPVLPPGATREALNARERLARQWWNTNAIKDVPSVVSKDFIIARLSEDRQRRFSLKEEIDVPLIAAARFYRAAYAAAEADPAQAEEVWRTEKGQILTQLEEDDSETIRAIRLCREFFEDLEAEIKSKPTAAFGQALRESAMIVGSVLLEHYNRGVEAVAGGQLPGGARAGGTSAAAVGGTAGGPIYSGYYGASHAAAHHARAMSRIRMRSERRMARIGVLP